MNKIKVIPLAAESMGVRSLCTIIETCDCKLLMDPSAALGRRFRKMPHPKEYKKLRDAISHILEIASSADIITISHYHYDHVRPLFTDYFFNWSFPEQSYMLYSGPQVYIKNPRNSINPSQRRRAYYFEKFAKKHNICLSYMDNATLEIGNTVISFSPPFPHGVYDGPLGYVICTRISYEDETVIFAPDIQGPMYNETLHWILECPPQLALIGGPPLYLLNYRLSNYHLFQAEQNLLKVLSIIPTVIVDHHVLRDKTWAAWFEHIRGQCDAENRLCCVAEYTGRPVEPLEANRKELYIQKPPDKQFIQWFSKKENRYQPPPID
ncbi:MAG: MBL fold metallo-hydrolase [Candidatus Ranarchaeia archaeon]